MMTIVLLSLLSLVFGKPAGDTQSLTAEVVPDLSSASAPAYWSAECGDRTYVGSYTLMMDWATPSALLTSWTLTPWSA